MSKAPTKAGKKKRSAKLKSKVHSTKKSLSKRSPRVARKKKKPSKRKPKAAFLRPVKPDKKLAQIVGPHPLPRSELTKKLWDYIEIHGLQDKKKRTIINDDQSLSDTMGGGPGAPHQRNFIL
jgi:chromatin remodeling complex protein RSC6